MVAPPASAKSSVVDDVDDQLEGAALLAHDGAWHEAIARLTDANRRQRDPRLERALVRLRHMAFDELDHPAAPDREPVPVELDLIDGLPSVAPDQLSAAALAQGIAERGCLFVPGLFDAPVIAGLVEGIERTFDAYDAWQADPRAPRDAESEAWFQLFHPVAPYTGRELGGREFTRSTGGVWTVESPRMLFEVIEAFEQAGLGSVITEHLGERPALSAAKCNLRRTPWHIPGGWHQDGSFLGRDLSTVDVWVALSDCGRDSAGLAVVPYRFDRLLPTGMDGVVTPHETVLTEIEPLDTQIVDREFTAGDTMLFDHMFLHRTSANDTMTRNRYALETWFFAPSHYPGQQIPLVF